MGFFNMKIGRSDMFPSMHRFFVTALLLTTFFSAPVYGTDEALRAEVDRRAEAVLEKVVAWRRDIHQHPELSHREFRTGALAAKHLEALGMEVRTGLAGTGVVGVLRGGRPGPVVALRADMDALPVTEQVDLPFASKVRDELNGQEVGVMHACGHDNHVAILMGAAEILAGMREELPGTVKFIFQPAEESLGGADVMVARGVLKDPDVDAIFGLHVTQGYAVGEIGVRGRGMMAASDGLEIKVTGRQTHGAMPWMGVDPIVAASHIVIGLQSVISRQSDLTAAPAVVTIGSFNGGVRGNIIPDEVHMTGTIRTFEPEMQTRIHERVRETAERIAESQGAVAEVIIRKGAPVTFNDPALTQRMRPSLERIAGPANVLEARRVTGAEDFAYYAERVPAMFFFIGVRPADVPAEEAIPNHSPFFYADEDALIHGVRAMASLAVDYLSGE
jgi:amidohydrolase